MIALVYVIADCVSMYEELGLKNERCSIISRVTVSKWYTDSFKF